MSLIDSTYFTGSINIQDDGVYGVLTDFITQYEHEALLSLLGYTAYKELAAEIQAGAYSPKWDRFVNGYEYSVGNYLVKWNGIKNSEKISLVSYYVYCKYLEAQQNKAASVGMVQIKTENSVLVDGLANYSASWNEFVRLYGYGGQDSLEPSALNFLAAHPDDFTNIRSKQFRFTNSFGI